MSEPEHIPPRERIWRRAKAETVDFADGSPDIRWQSLLGLYEEVDDLRNDRPTDGVRLQEIRSGLASHYHREAMDAGFVLIDLAREVGVMRADGACRRGSLKTLWQELARIHKLDRRADLPLKRTMWVLSFELGLMGGLG